jgi:hypothetical protein
MGPIGSKRYVNVVCFDAPIDTGGGEGKSPYIALALRVVDGDDVGRNFTKRGYLSEKASPITFSQMRALGWTGTKISKAMSEGLGSRKASAMLVVKQLDNGKIIEEVVGIYEPKEFKRTTDNPVTEDNLDAFDALFADAAGAVEVTPLKDNLVAPPLPPSRRAGTPSTPVANPNDLGF